MFTLVQIRCFAAVAQDLNFRKAARRLNMTQPPLSRHIQALEHEVGAPLIDRSTRVVRLTAAGQSFARSAQRLLQQAAEAVQDARRIARGDAGALTIGFTAASSYVFLPRMVALLRAYLPALALTLREMTTPEQLVALQAEQIDCGFMRPFSRPGLHAVRVWRETLVLAVPSGHPLASREQVGLPDIGGETLITYPPVEGPYFHDLITGLLHVAGVTPSGVQHITQTHSILALVGAGLGVAVVPRSAEQCLPQGVAIRPLAGIDEVRSDLVLGWPDAARNPACDALVNLVRQHREALLLPSVPARAVSCAE